MVRSQKRRKTEQTTLKGIQNLLDSLKGRHPGDATEEEQVIKEINERTEKTAIQKKNKRVLLLFAVLFEGCIVEC